MDCFAALAATDIDCLAVVAGLVPAIHDFSHKWHRRMWMPGISPGMTSLRKTCALDLTARCRLSFANSSALS